MPEDKPVKHPPYPKEGKHLFSRWMAMTKIREYRVCTHPDCHYHEERIVTG